jgi:signal transduction histidine kinase
MEIDTQTGTAAIRAQIQDLLNQGDEADYSKLIALTSELAKHDPDNVRFTTDAGVVGKFGQELFSRPETAVAELIKNGYDADATQVTLVFKDIDEPGGHLEIEDDGHGMTREQLIEGFMRISSDTKVREPVSPRYGRQRAGRKGIGRFATQHLGRKLVITTHTLDAEEALQVTINWADFEAGRDLGTITSRIETVPKVRDEGTRLDIYDLRQTWTEASIKRVYRYISGIIQPFPLSEKIRDTDIDPGFHVSIYQEGGEDYELIADERKQIHEHALAIIEGEVDASGQGRWWIESDKLGIDRESMLIGIDPDNPESPFPHLHDVKFKLYYFIYNKGYIPKLQRKRIRRLASSQGGIRVYRNGLRVAPYGEPDNDWLGLDQSMAYRRILPSHGNPNFFGFVEIHDRDGKQFEEKSSREGLIENEAFKEMQDVIYRSVRGGVRRVAEERSRKQTSTQKDWAKEKSASEELESASQEMADLADQAEKTSAGDGSAENPIAQALRDHSKRFEEKAEQQKRVEKRRLEELAMMRVLAGLGLSIGEFAHEIRQPINSIQIGATTLGMLLSKPVPEVRKETVAIKQNAENLKAYTAYLEQAVSENTRRDLKTEGLRVVLERFVDAAEATADRSGITLKTVIKGYDLYPRPMHPSEWASVLFNFFTNARKAGATSVLLRAGWAGDDVFLEFIDDGSGISPEHETRIFDAFFTTTGASGRFTEGIDDAAGMGLGLKIVRDTITGYGGVIKLGEPPVGYSTAFRIELPAATDEEIETYAD